MFFKKTIFVLSETYILTTTTLNVETHRVKKSHILLTIHIHFVSSVLSNGNTRAQEMNILKNPVIHITPDALMTVHENDLAKIYT